MTNRFQGYTSLVLHEVLVQLSKACITMPICGLKGMGTEHAGETREICRATSAICTGYCAEASPKVDCEDSSMGVPVVD